MSDTAPTTAQGGVSAPVDVPVSAILGKLPSTIAPLIVGPPGAAATFRVSSAELQKQLPTGAVKVSFGELRVGVQPGIFAETSAHDSTPVVVPLEEILKHVDRSHLARRPEQKTAFFPADMKPPFVRKGDAAAVAAAPAQGKGAPASDASRHTQHVPKPATAVARPSGTAAFLKASLAELSAGWPEGLRREITVLGIAGLALPTDDIGAALKTGRVAYSWKLLRTWAMPVAVLQASAYDEIILTLPLNVITPLFLGAQHKALAPTPTAPPPPQTSSRSKLTPAEFVRAALQMPGVAGAFVSSRQGLLVAQQMPIGMPADRVASMLPQAFTRLEQATEGMNVGKVTSFTTHNAGVPWLLFESGSFLVGVVGRGTDSLPASQLQAIVAELSR